MVLYRFDLSVRPQFRAIVMYVAKENALGRPSPSEVQPTKLIQQTIPTIIRSSHNFDSLYIHERS